MLLALVGVRILVRFSMPITTRPAAYPVVVDRSQTTGASAAGAVGGVTNGLIGTSGARRHALPPAPGSGTRYVVGCVNTAEIAVALVAARSLLTMLGGDELRWDVIAAMLLGGCAAAPLAAYVVPFETPRLLGLAVAGLLLLTQARELATTIDLPGNRWSACPRGRGGRARRVAAAPHRAPASTGARRTSSPWRPRSAERCW